MTLTQIDVRQALAVTTMRGMSDRDMFRGEALRKSRFGGSPIRNVLTDGITIAWDYDAGGEISALRLYKRAVLSRLRICKCDHPQFSGKLCVKTMVCLCYDTTYGPFGQAALCV